jgi:hypothetical protein
LSFSKGSQTTVNVERDRTNNNIWKFPEFDQSIAEQPCAPAFLSESKAIAFLWEVPEVQQKAQQILALSQGKVYLAAMVSDEANSQEILRYYNIQVFEQHPDQIVTIWFFRVDKLTGAITVSSVDGDTYLPLQAWREQQQ